MFNFESVRMPLILEFPQLKQNQSLSICLYKVSYVSIFLKWHFISFFYYKKHCSPYVHINMTVVYAVYADAVLHSNDVYKSCPSALFPHFLGKHLPICSEAQAAEFFRLPEKGSGACPLGWGVEETSAAERAERGCSAAWNITAKKQRSGQTYPLPFNLISV